jgi:hypothetical protein
MNPRPLASAATVAVVSALATLAYAQPEVVVQGDATCPSVAMILAALPVARPDAAWPEQTVTVEVSDGRLSLLLGDAPAVRREIPADKDCSVRAESVAVVIAAWAGELGDRPTASPMLTVSIPAPALLPEKKPTQAIEVDGAAFYSSLWGHAPGAWLGVGRMPREGGMGVRLFGAYQSARDVALEGGTNQVLRFLVGAALTYRLQWTRVFFVASDVGLVGTLTHAQGAGYEPNQSGYAGNVGGVADLRAGLRLGRTRLWVNARGLRMVHAETVKVQSTSPGVADSATLSAWDVQLGVGLGVRFD